MFIHVALVIQYFTVVQYGEVRFKRDFRKHVRKQVSDKGLSTFEQQHVGVAEAKRVRRHQTSEPAPNKAAGNRLHGMRPCLRLNLRSEETHALTKRNALSSELKEGWGSEKDVHE